MTVQLIPSHAKYRDALLTIFAPLGKESTAEELYELGLAEHENEEDREKYFSTLIADLENRVKGGKRSLVELGYKHTPVDPETFLKDPYFLGLEDEVYPELIPYYVEMNSGKYVEAILTGGIGSGKSSLAVWIQAYQVYLVSCLRNPHAVYGLDRSSEIEFIFQSKTKELADAVDYDRFKTLILRSEYFRRNFAPQAGLKSELNFPNRVIVKPVAGGASATIGQNVMGGMIDEINYMAVIQDSKRMMDGGVYDQAVALYNSISRRRKSRFLKLGKLPGILCLVSSKKYPGQFTDQKEAEREKEIAEKGESSIYLYDKRVWEIKPNDFSKERFRVFIGDHFRKPRILKKEEEIASGDEKKIALVPEEFRTDFERDIVDSLREIAGVSHLSKHPFFSNAEPLLKVFKKEIRPIFNLETVNFDDKLLEIFKKSLRRLDPRFPRYVHLDLGLTADAAGLAIAHVPKFVRVDRGEGLFETMPYISFDGVLRITPPRGGQIMFFKIRRILYLLMSLGMPIRWATLDSFQSADTLQVLMQKGLQVGNLSMDTSMLPYDMFKSATLDFRIECPIHEFALDELRNLQIDFEEQKVDHLPQGSKDVADAMAGCVYGLTTRRDIWHLHEVPISESVMDAVKKSDKKMKETKSPQKTDDPYETMKKFYGGDEEVREG